MDVWTSIFAIVAALLLGAMSPGPSFIVVARTTVGLSRKDGLATAVGMGVGGIVFCSLALAGLYAVLAAVGWLYLIAKLAGALYLLNLAWQLWKGASTPLELAMEHVDRPPSLLKSFWTGLSTQLSNPKTALVYGGIFAALLPQHVPIWCYPVLISLVFMIEAGWYSLVALVFSSSGPRAVYLNAKTLIDRVAALAIGALGIRLALTSNSTGL